MKHLSLLMKKSNIEIKHFNSRESLKSFLNKKNFSNSVVLVKGSRGMRMEEFVQTIEAGTL
jgi:UDP-N-acetylmuramoyl-tripeptide--D-alanyl-D-alanine ligase